MCTWTSELYIVWKDVGIQLYQIIIDSSHGGETMRPIEGKFGVGSNAKFPLHN